MSRVPGATLVRLQIKRREDTKSLLYESLKKVVKLEINPIIDIVLLMAA